MDPTTLNRVTECMSHRGVDMEAPRTTSWRDNSKVTTKRKKLTLNEKIEIIKQVEENPHISKQQMAKRYNIAASSLCNLILQKDAIRETALTCGPYAMNKKNLKLSPYDRLEKELMQWFHKVRAENTLITAQLLRRKAFEISVDLNIANFGASNGWLERFKKRHGLCRQVTGGESTYTVQRDEGCWKKVLPLLIDGFHPVNVFMAGAIRFIHGLRPKDCQNFKSSNFEKITVFLCFNVHGTEKLPPIVIGSQPREKCLEMVDSLPCKYYYDPSSALNPKIFTEFLRELDLQMRKQQDREILLFLEKTTAAMNVTTLLTNIKLVNYPNDANLWTSEFLPHFKASYRKAFIRKLLAHNEINKELNLDIFQALHLVSTTWRALPSSIISETFRSLGFNIKKTPTVIENEEFLYDTWENIREDFDISFENYIKFDDCIPTLAQEDEDKSQHEQEEKEEEIIPSFGEAVSGFEALKKYLCSFELNEATMTQLNELEWKLMFISQQEQYK